MSKASSFVKGYKRAQDDTEGILAYRVFDTEFKHTVAIYYTQETAQEHIRYMDEKYGFKDLIYQPYRVKSVSDQKIGVMGIQISYCFSSNKVAKGNRTLRRAVKDLRWGEDNVGAPILLGTVDWKDRVFEVMWNVGSYWSFHRWIGYKG